MMTVTTMMLMTVTTMMMTSMIIVIVIIIVIPISMISLAGKACGQCVLGGLLGVQRAAGRKLWTLPVAGLARIRGKTAAR